MERDFLRGILLRDEDERTEFKITYSNKTDRDRDEVAKDLVALANAAGRTSKDFAYLVIGAGDERDVSGNRPTQDVQSSDYSARSFRDIVGSRCTPPLELLFEVVEVDSHTYGVVTIPPSPEIHSLTKDLVMKDRVLWKKNSVLTRIGDEVQVATHQQIETMKHEKRWGKPALIAFTPVTSNFPGFRQTGEDVTTYFHPSFEEFKRGEVYRPRLVDRALASLRTHGRAWLRGVSASGKSTIALHLAVELSTPSVPPLYLNLDDELDLAVACHEISSTVQEGRLFILDNAHIDPHAAAALLRWWEQDQQGSLMLLLGWPTDERVETRHLAAYRFASIDVVPAEEDLLGVYATLRRRLRRNEFVIQTPPREMIRDWFARFGADLVAFQLAVAATLRAPGDPGWSLDARAAKGYAREKYLSGCSEEERTDLLRLAVFSDIGLSVPEEYFRSAMPESSKRGTIRKSEHGRFGLFVRFQLWHQALGKILLAASPVTIDRAAEFTHAAAINPFFGCFVGQRLWLRNEQELAISVLRSAVNSGVTILGIFGDNLNVAAKQVEFLNTTKVLRFAETATTLAAPAVLDGFAERAWATPLHSLVCFLGFAKKHEELSPAYNALAKAFVAEAGKPEADNRLLAQALATQLDQLANFLGFAKKHEELSSGYEALAKALVAEASKPANNRLLAQALATPLHFLASFLGFAKKHEELSPAYKALAKALVAEADKLEADNRLLAQALATPLHFLANFLGFAKTHEELRPAYKALVKALVAEAGKLEADNRLLAQALATPLSRLASFLGFAKKHEELSPAYKALAKVLVAEAGKLEADNRLLAQALATPLHSLANFLGFAKTHEELRPAYKALAKALIAEAGKLEADNRLLARALISSLDELAGFLELTAQQDELNPIYETLAKALVAEANKPLANNRLVAKALATPLDHLGGFLKLGAQREELDPTYEALAKVLVAEASKLEADNQLLAKALATPLDHLAGFLDLARQQKELVPIFNVLAKALVTEAGRPLANNRLVAQALATPFEHLASFLDFLAEQEELKPAVQPLIAALESRATDLARVLIGATFDQISSILEVAPALGSKVLSKVDEKAWRHKFSKGSQEPAKGFGSVAHQLSSLGFANLAEPPATHLVKEANPMHWRSQWVSLIDVSHALRYSSVAEECKAEFLRRVVSRNWLIDRLYKQTLIDLANGLFHLLAHQSPGLISAFVSILKQRVEKDLPQLPEKKPEDLNAILQFWAAAELAGARILIDNAKWPSPKLAEELTLMILPHPTKTEGIGYIQQQLWMGIRIFARYHPCPISMPPELVTETLRRWKATMSQADRTPAQRSWDAGMIRWLERCVGSQGSQLFKDSTFLDLALGVKPGKTADTAPGAQG